MKTYVTGSVDKTCKLWDIRDEKAKQTFFGHDADVNSVCVRIMISILTSTYYSVTPLISNIRLIIIMLYVFKLTSRPTMTYYCD